MEEKKVSKCPSCGSKLDENVKFCPYCGSSVSTQTSPANKSQNMQQINGQTQNGQPFVYFNVPEQNLNTGANTVAMQNTKKKTGVFVAGIVCFFIGLIFLLAYGMLYAQMISAINSNNGWEVLGFILYLITFGWISIIPAAALHIASLCCSISSVKSSSKTYRVFSIIIMVLSIISLVALLVSIVLAQLGVFNS